MISILRGLLVAATVSSLIHAAGEDSSKSHFRQTDLFISGEEGYDTYRIPSIIATPSGTLLAFCEGRKHSRSDTGDIDLVLKRSEDMGVTWSKQRIVWDDDINTCGNPCPVVDQQTGTIWLLLTHNLGEDDESEIVAGTSKGSRTVWVTSSEDDGLTWDQPKEITDRVKKSDWTWYATGPGIGIQLTQPPYTGRLVIPCDHKTQGDEIGYYSHILYSDDHGSTWQLGGITQNGVNECQVVERIDGTLLLNMRRSQNNPAKTRAIADSRDGGMSWSDLRYDPVLIEPRCQASMIRFTTIKNSNKTRILFSNPASERREAMTARMSYDEGDTWPVGKTIHEGSSAYSCLVILSDRSIGCLYERDDYRTITFARFTLEWLTGGADSLD